MLNEEEMLATFERIENSMLAMDWAWNHQNGIPLVWAWKRPDQPLVSLGDAPEEVGADLRTCYAYVVALRELFKRALALDKMDYEALAKMTYADTLETLQSALRQQSTLNLGMDERKLGTRILANAIKHHEAEPEEEP